MAITAQNVEQKAGYKQTEVGLIPEDWLVRTLGDIVDKERPICYGIVQTGKSINNGVLCVRVVDLNNGKISRESLITTSKDISNSYKRTILREGDLVVALRGKIGELAIVERELTGANLTRGIALIAVAASLDACFFLHQLSSRNSKTMFEKNLNGSALQEIPINVLRKIPVAYPRAKSEQTAIANTLFDIDSLIESLDKLIAKKRDIKQATMQQLLTGKTRLPGFRGEWEMKKLENECELITKGTTPTSIGKIFSTNGVNFIKIESLTDEGNIIRDKLAFIDEETHRLLTRSQLKNKDILFSIAGALGRTTLIKQDVLPANINQALALIRLKNQSRLDHTFLLKYLTSPEIVQHIGSINVQAAQANLSLEDIKNFEIRIPKIPEQQAIATVLSDMDAEIVALEQRRDKTRALKQGMMQELLTGKTRLL